MGRKPDYFYRQSAIIPYQQWGEEISILLITSRKKQRWIIPKGIVEPQLTSAESAAKEALEEAGVSGMVYSQSIGSYTVKKWGGTCLVEVFVMRVEDVRDEWEEDFRHREWLELSRAINRLHQVELQEICRRLPYFLEQND